MARRLRPSDLRRKAGYWRRAPARKLSVLHEDRECLMHNSGAAIAQTVSLSDARDLVRWGRARLCRRCGSLR